MQYLQNWLQEAILRQHYQVKIHLNRRTNLQARCAQRTTNLNLRIFFFNFTSFSIILELPNPYRAVMYFVVDQQVDTFQKTLLDRMRFPVDNSGGRQTLN